MNVFVVGRSLPEKVTGFAGEFEFTQAKELKKRDINITYLFTDTRSIRNFQQVSFLQSNNEVDTYGAYLPIGGIPHFIHAPLKFCLFKKVWNQAVKEHGKPDIVHFHFPLITCNELIFDFIKKQNIKIVVTEHWTKVQTNRLKPVWRKFLKKILLESDAVIAVSDDLKDSIQNITHSQREIFVIPNMVGSSFEIKKEISKESKKFKFFGLGRFVPHKNFDLLIKAFSISFKDYPEVSLEIAGDGPERKSLEKLIRSLGLEEQVSLLGRIDNSKVGVVMNSSQVIVVPSSLETFGVPIIEGWFMGKPVIASDNNPLLNYFNSTNGTLFHNNDYRSLAESLKEAYLNYEKYEYEEISKSAFLNFSSQTICEKIKEIYTSL